MPLTYFFLSLPSPIKDEGKAINIINKIVWDVFVVVEAGAKGGDREIVTKKREKYEKNSPCFDAGPR
jgi:hypothetical protein